MSGMQTRASRTTAATQYEAMLEFMQNHGDIGSTTNRIPNSSNLWKALTKQLNDEVNGGVKDAKKWAKTWADWKFNTKTKLLAGKPLNAQEKELVELMGYNTNHIKREFPKSEPASDLDELEDGDASGEDPDYEAGSDLEEEKPKREKPGPSPLRPMNQRQRALLKFANLERNKLDYDTKIKAKRAKRIEIERKRLSIEEKRLDRVEKRLDAIEWNVNNLQESVEQKQNVSQALVETLNVFQDVLIKFINNKKNN